MARQKKRLSDKIRDGQTEEELNRIDTVRRRTESDKSWTDKIRDGQTEEELDWTDKIRRWTEKIGDGQIELKKKPGQTEEEAMDRHYARWTD